MDTSKWVIDFLLARGAVADVVDSNGCNTLHHICEDRTPDGALAIVSALLNGGIKAEQKNNKGVSAPQLLLDKIETRFSTVVVGNALKKNQIYNESYRRTLILLLQHLPDSNVERLCYGEEQVLVFALRHQLDTLVLELLPRTKNVDGSYSDTTTAMSPIEAACRYPCSIETFKALATKSNDLSKPTPNGDCLLHLAVKALRLDILKHLLGHKVDVNARNQGGSTALQLVAAGNSIEILGALLDAGADASLTTADGLSVLHLSMSSEDKATFDLIKTRSKHIDFEACTSEGMTPLLMAALLSRLERVRSLLSMGVNLSATDNKGLNVLHIAASNLVRGGEITELVLESQGSPSLEARTSARHTPLLLAAAAGNLRAFSKLLESGARVDVADSMGNTILHHIAFGGQILILEHLISKGATATLDIEARGEVDRTPLLITAFSGHHLVFAKLLDLGADINAHGSDGWGVVALAAYKGHKTILQVLLRKGLPPNTLQTGKSLSPLIEAVGNHNWQVAKILLEAGADMTYTSPQDGRNVIHVAASKSFVWFDELLEFAVENRIPIDIEAEDNGGKTALMLADEQDEILIAERLRNWDDGYMQDLKT